MQTRQLGRSGLTVSAMGLGCMECRISMASATTYGIRRTAFIHAIDHGLNFLDTADTYGPHTNEELVAQGDPRAQGAGGHRD